MVSGEITADTTWTADNLYVLTELVFVRSPAVLTIEAGTQVHGNNGSALVVTRGARIEATGTAAEPIVFTSSKAVGMRAPGDWGGVVLLGAAPINVGEARIEGIAATDNRGFYGGDDAAHDCGTIRYARIEFAGFEIGEGNELNGLTVGGCGSGTELDFVQVHFGLDDGIELFGGTASLRHALVTRASDDSLDWDQGWVGTVQFLAVVQDPADADSGFEADNGEDNNDALPRSAPTIFNVTLVGTNDPASDERAMVLRRGTAGIIRNAILMGFPNDAIDVRDPSTVMQTPDGLLVSHSIFFQNGADGTTHFPDETAGTEDDDDGAFDEAAYFQGEGLENRFDIDPMLAQAFSVSAPNLVPGAGSPAAVQAATPPSGFDATATYVGAFEPGGDDWTAGWTAFPED